MAVHEAVILGQAVVTFMLFYLWKELREEHPNMSLFVFAVAIGGLNVLTFTVSEMMQNEASVAYLAGYAYVIFFVVMWLSIILAVYVFTSMIWAFMLLTANWVMEKTGGGSLGGRVK